RTKLQGAGGRASESLLPLFNRGDAATSSSSSASTGFGLLASSASSSSLSANSSATAAVASSTGDHLAGAAAGNAGEADDPSSGASLSGWFGSSSLLSGAAERDPLLRCLGLSRKQRVLAFVTLLLLGSLFLSLSLVFLPMVLLKARRFAVLYSMGSLCLLLSFSALWGPVNHLRHLVTGPRRPFTCAYLLMLAATLYSAMGLRSGPLALLFVCLQVAALLWYLISYLPGGQRGIRFLTSVFYSAASRTAKTTLPI
ncbi:hypothetical protein BOX15_Mlig008945g1, partial [Macrostomum lignano]